MRVGGAIVEITYLKHYCYHNAQLKTVLFQLKVLLLQHILQGKALLLQHRPTICSISLSIGRLLVGLGEPII